MKKNKFGLNIQAFQERITFNFFRYKLHTKFYSIPYQYYAKGFEKNVEETVIEQQRP